MKMNNDDLIILYLDNQMTDKEKIEFEELLKNSPDLKERFLKISSSLDIVKSTSNPEYEEYYFNNILPEFRRRAGQKEKSGRSFMPRFAAAVSGIGVVALLLFIFVFNSNINNNINGLNELDFAELENIFSSYPLSDQISSYYGITGGEISERIDSLITQNYLLAGSAGIYLEYNSVLRSISDEDADLIYSQLINKDIISGEL
jgi:hypothetical protein